MPGDFAALDTSFPTTEGKTTEQKLDSMTDYLYQLLREDRGILPLPRDMIPEELDYAMAVRGKPAVEPSRVYCSTLRSSFYDATTYKLLERIYGEVLQTE